MEVLTMMCLMKKTLIAVILAVLFLGLNSISSYAYVIDGDLSDWGVTPFTDWVPDCHRVDYVVEDDFNRPGSDPFWEGYDLEAMYFNDDADYYYFAIVSSNAYTNNWASEDMGIDLDLDGEYEFGVDVANAALNTLSTKGVYSVDSWKIRDGHEYRIDSGTQLGTYDVYNRFLGYVEPGANPSYTYAIEGRIDKMLLGDLDCGDPFNMHFTRTTCLKDWITVEGTVSYPCIPEPAALLLFGPALLGAGLARKKK